MGNQYIDQASEEREELRESEIPIDEFLDFAQDNPISVSDATSYILAAIEHFGARTVFEDGEEKERYRFFDDPYGNGEHAILGNNDLLNEFVDELRRRASEEGENDKIIWFVGPTATGKSELKRCLINGIKGFAETEEGQRYTLEWTLDNFDGEASGMTYGDTVSSQREYYKSPVNTNPLSLLPQETREQFLNDLEENYQIDSQLDPFSREAFEVLQDNSDSFSEIVEQESVRATRYYPEVGDGIGVLHTEDTGNPKQKLVGGWMDGAMQKFAKRGQKNPQAFSYDGVVSQGNRLVSIVEDASHHHDVLDKMINVCEEEMVKLDNKISMMIDTLIVIFSNPDLEMQLNEHSSAEQDDPLRALRRRLDKYQFSYLTTVSTEGLLLKRLLTDKNYLWEDCDDMMEQVVEPEEIYDCEVAPRTIQAVALYEVVSRLCRVKTDLTTVRLACLLNDGEVSSTVGGDIFDFESVDIEQYDMGGYGIPSTFTIDVLVEMCQEKDIVLPGEATEEIRTQMKEEPMFSEEELEHFRTLVYDVNDYIYVRQREDVLEAMIGDINVTEDDVRDYIDSVFAWQDGDSEDYDAYELMEFEVRYLGQERENYNDSAAPDSDIRNFRENVIIPPINKYIWEQKGENFEVSEVPLSECPELEPLLEKNDWDAVQRVFPDADLSQWKNPPSDTETQELKTKTVNRMMELMDYSKESAKRVSNEIVSLRVQGELE